MTEATTANRPIWFDTDGGCIKVIDQRHLPHRFVVADLVTVDDVIGAIQEMFVRGAPLIGATGALGVYTILAGDSQKAGDDAYVKRECERLKAARPTAVNLAWGVDLVCKAVLEQKTAASRINACLSAALSVVELEAENCRKIGENGVGLIETISSRKNGAPVNILTHCNAGRLACIEYGTATAPVYKAHEKGLKVHVWVDETRPLNQGSRLTAWELAQAGVDHTVVTDNAGGHLMQCGMVDLVIVGTDRTTRAGDVANKIGTYLKALAARDNGIDFYVALPSSTFDWNVKDGRQIPIEERSPDEVRFVRGLDPDGTVTDVMVPPEKSPAANPAFDITPAHLVTGFITERGVCDANEDGIVSLFPENREEIL